MEARRTRERRRWGVVGVASLLGLFCAVVLLKAWVCDDAYITFRTVYNLFQGHGLRFNVEERVQAYTHPLWMLSISALYAVTREFFYTSMVFGTAVSIAAVLLFARRLAPSAAAACLGLAVLTASQAFTDFSTAGLENPLSHLWIGLFCAVLWNPRPEARRAPALVLVAALAMVTRLDLGLLFLPALVYVCGRVRSPRMWGWILLGSSPFWIWEAFSMLYYGFPVANSVLAKLNTGIPAADLAAQSGRYYLKALRWDPVTLSCIAAGILTSLWRRDRRGIAVAAGVVLYLAYVVRVGGDFMNGRFFTVPLLAAVILLARARLQAQLTVLGASIALLVLATQLWAQGGFVRSGYRTNWKQTMDSDGIVDERSFYAHLTSWRGGRGQPRWPQPEAMRQAGLLHRYWQEDPLLEDMKRVGLVDQAEAWPPHSRKQASGEPYHPVIVRGAIGYLAYYVGPQFHVLDFHALTDPLLAQLNIAESDPVLRSMVPSMAHAKWRIGHFTRLVPLGYVETLATGENRIRDPDLAEFYDKITLVTRGRIFDRRRAAAILDLCLRRDAERLRAAVRRGARPPVAAP